MRIRKIAALLIVSVVALGTPTQAEWPQQSFNPVPMEDDVVFPLPCDGNIAFRKVTTGEAADPARPQSLLSDKEIQLGRPTNGTRGYMENRRTEYIDGAIGSEGKNLYLIGKYEITVAQYDAVMANSEADCPVVNSPAQAVPKSSVSWYDAVEFTRRMNNWVYGAGGADVVSMQITVGILDGYFRLPTETEWEFAARGGLVLPDAERADATFPMPEGIDAYAWSNGPQSANGKLRPVGTRKPNPLGIFDVYGNVSEIVLEPFRMTRASRLHGRIGGFVTKGGSFLDDPGSINSALRNEYPYFSQVAQGEVRERRIGFRVVMGTVAIGGNADVGALEAASIEAERQNPDVSEEESAAARLALAAQQTEDAKLKRDLEDVRAELTAEFERRNQLEDKAIRASLVNAAMSAREILLSERVINTLYNIVTDPTAPNHEQMERRLQDERRVFDQFTRRHGDAIQDLANDYAERVPDQVGIVTRELEEEGSGELIDFVKLVQRQVADYSEGRVTETRDILLSMLKGDHPWL